MNRLLILASTILLMTLFSGCEKEMMGYEGREGVYFSVRHNAGSTLLESLWPYQPYSDVDFVRIAADQVDYTVKVMITGPVKDYDRTFGLVVNPDSTTAILGQHYEPVTQQWTIPAGAVSTLIKVRIKRTADLEDNPVILGLKLVPTADFALSFPEWDAIPEYNQGIIVPEFDAGLHALRINDIMIRPAVWSGTLQAGNRESGLFGVFTRQKMEFLMEYLDLKYEDFASLETMPVPRQMLIANDATAILIQRYNENNPVLENDGRLMWLGTVPWTSYIGVPWVPVP